MVHNHFLIGYDFLSIPIDAKKSKHDTTSAEIRADMQKAPLKFERRIYFMFPQPNEHTTHKLGQVSKS